MKDRYSTYCNGSMRGAYSRNQTVHPERHRFLKLDGPPRRHLHLPVTRVHVYLSLLC